MPASTACARCLTRNSPHGRGRALRRRACRVCRTRGRRQCRGCRGRGGHRARRPAKRSGRTVAGVAPIMIYRADEARGIDHQRPRHLAARASTPNSFRSEHGGKIPQGVLRTVIAGRARRLDHGAGELRHDELRRLRRAPRSASRARAFPMYGLMSDMIAMHAADYARWPSSAAILSARTARRRGAARSSSRPTCGRTLQYMADQEKSAAAASGRAAGLESCARRFLSRRHRAHHRCLPRGQRRPRDGAGPGRISRRRRAAGERALRRHRHVFLRPRGARARCCCRCSAC